MSELLRLVNIHKNYRMGPDTVAVLRGVDLSLQEGEFVAIMGASGSGKSTLLHIAGALDQPGEVPLQDQPAQELPAAPKKGEVLFRSRRADGSRGEMQSVSAMGRWKRHWLRNQEFGFVFQFYHLLPELNVLENVLLPAMIEAPFYKALVRARPRKEDALRLIDHFGLTPRIRHRPGQLSGGERQRVAIARALINKPSLLLADEPTGNLDAKTGRAILDVLVKLHKEQGQTMLLVTHDPNVAGLADRTVHLADGRIRG